MEARNIDFACRAAMGTLAAAAAITCPSPAFADNPIVQTIYTGDPAPLFFAGRVYVYTGHDEDTLVNDFFTMNEWRVYSSADMVNWTDHGVPLKYTDFAWAKSNAWAAQTIYRDGKFYFYATTAQGIGVAVSSSPTGPFKDAIGKALIANSGCGDIDPTVFIDDDGQAYLYWGNPNCCYVKLNADMISYSGGVVKVPMTTASFGVRSSTDRATSYEEGPWIYRRGSLYYLVYAGGPISEHIAYSTSPSPTGPWTYRGVVMATQGSSFTNHPGVVDFNGSSYFVYHNGALPGGGGYHRSVAIEKLSYDADGAIPALKMSTAGVPAVGTLNPFAAVEAETIAWESGVETAPCSEGGMAVVSISDGDYIKVRSVDFAAGATAFEARVAASSAGGNIELYLDSLTGTKIATCPVTATGGADTYATITCAVTGATGAHDLFLKFRGGSGDLFTFNWWKFTGPGAGLAGDAGVSDASRPEAGDTGGIIATDGRVDSSDAVTATGGKPGVGGTGAGGASGTGGVGATGGVTASGGSPGTGGSARTGGAGGSGGTGGNDARAGGAPGGSGSPGSGGAVNAGASGGFGTGGALTTGGVTGGRSTSSGGGCSCRLDHERHGAGTSVTVLVGLALALLRSRRKPRQQPDQRDPMSKHDSR